MKLKTLFNKNRFLSVNAEFIFYFPASDPAFLRAFFSNLWPKREVIEKVNKFLEEKFGDKPFAAVHLRHLENSCPQRMFIFILKATFIFIRLYLCFPVFKFCLCNRIYTFADVSLCNTLYMLPCIVILMIVSNLKGCLIFQFKV